MYIEFQLPRVIKDNPQAIAIAIFAIEKDLKTWIEKHNIRYYKTKIHKHTYRLCLATDEDYSFFALTWQPKHYASKQFIFKNPK